MLESFLILLAGGVLFATAISDAKQVTLHWLRLGGILALSFAGIAACAMFWHSGHDARTLAVTIATLVCICGQLAFVQLAARSVQRAFALGAFIASVFCGAMMIERVSIWPMLSCAGVGATCGIALMDMLLGHAYLTASKMTIAPFRRINLALAIALGIRAMSSIVIVTLLNQRRPVDRLWLDFGLLIGTRWLVGLLVPAVFVYMAHDCIKRRSTQSATGILYVAGVVIFIGEIIALQLARDTGLPF